MHKVYYIKKPNKTEIIVEGNLITLIPKGFMSAMNKGLSGEKTFRLKDIISVQIKKPGFTSGYIQFGILGDSSHKQGVISAASDENSVMFTKKNYDEMLELKSYIDNYEEHLINQVSTSSVSDELFKLKKLLDEGIITESEFSDMKSKLIN